jgi:hypothetical protein
MYKLSYLDQAKEDLILIKRFIAGKAVVGKLLFATLPKSGNNAVR